MRLAESLNQPKIPPRCELVRDDKLASLVRDDKLASLVRDDTRASLVE